MKKKNLVVVRAGNASLHPEFLDRPYSERRFDTVVSFFSEEAYHAFQPEKGVTAVLQKGGKWDGLFATLSGIDLEQYDYFWLPDDDIRCTGQDVDAIFSLTEQHGLSISQPALTHNSYFSHFIFFQCPDFRLRYTNFIEIMVPCLRRDLLKRVLPLFNNTMSGAGLDYIWCRMPESGAFRAAILDGVAVHHTRPVGKVLASVMKSGGASAEVEEKRLKDKFGLKKRVYPIVYCGLLTNGDILFGKAKMSLRMVRAWFDIRRTFPAEARPYFKFYQTISRAFRKPAILRYFPKESGESDA